MKEVKLGQRWKYVGYPSNNGYVFEIGELSSKIIYYGCDYVWQDDHKLSGLKVLSEHINTYPDYHFLLPNQNKPLC